MLEEKMESWNEGRLDWHLHSTRISEGSECPICSEYFADESDVWRLSHPAANPHTGYVCCSECQSAWIEAHWEEVDEWEMAHGIQ